MSSWGWDRDGSTVYPSSPILVLVFSIELFQGTARHHRRGEPWESIEIGRSPVAGHTIANVDIGGACHRPQPRLSPGLAITPRMKRTRSGAAGRSVSRGGEHGLMKVRKTNSTVIPWPVRRVMEFSVAQLPRRRATNMDASQDMHFRTLARLAVRLSVYREARSDGLTPVLHRLTQVLHCCLGSTVPPTTHNRQRFTPGILEGRCLTGQHRSTDGCREGGGLQTG